MEIFNIISGTCSIIGLIISCFSFAKITKTYKIMSINQTIDKSIHISQKGIGIGNENSYKGGNKNG